MGAGAGAGAGAGRRVGCLLGCGQTLALLLVVSGCLASDSEPRPAVVGRQQVGIVLHHVRAQSWADDQRIGDVYADTAETMHRLTLIRLSNLRAAWRTSASESDVYVRSGEAIVDLRHRESALLREVVFEAGSAVVHTERAYYDWASNSLSTNGPTAAHFASY